MNKAFDAAIINALERPLSSDQNMITSYAQLAVRELMLQLFATKDSAADSDRRVVEPVPNAAGFIGSSFRARALGVPAMGVTLDFGLGLLNTNVANTNVGGISGLNDISPLKPLVLTPTAAEVGAGIGGIPNGDGANPRVDLIEVKLNRLLADATNRDILDPITGQFNPLVVQKTLSYALDGTATVNGAGAINYKTGAPGGGNVYPVGAPAVDAGYVAIAYVNVGTAAAAITNGMIVDAREMLYPSGIMRASGKFNVQDGPLTIISRRTCPPGVSFTAFNPNGAGVNPGIILYLIAGNGSFSNVDWVASVDNLVGALCNVGVTADFARVNASAGDVANMAAGIPGLTCAVGQPVWKATLGIVNTNFNDGVSYNARFMIEAQR